MKIKIPLLPLLIILLVSIFQSCDKNEEEVPVSQISLLPVSDVGETSFVVNWEIKNIEVTGIVVEVSLHDSFTALVHEEQVPDIAQPSFQIDQLNGATKYFYRIKVMLQDGSINYSSTKSVQTTFKIESVSFTTSDGVNIAGKLKYLESIQESKPGIIFMHEMGIWINNWTKADLVLNCIAEGYACLIFDFRGHMSSGDYPMPGNTTAEIEAFIIKCSNDLIAAIEFMQSHEEVNGNKLALAGGSLGATIAIAGNGYDEVKATISLSGGSLGANSIFPGKKVNSAFFIAGENDITPQGINFAQEATNMFENAEEPKKLQIILATNKHGTNLLNPELDLEILDWINAMMER